MGEAADHRRKGSAGKSPCISIMAVVTRLPALLKAHGAAHEHGMFIASK